MRPQNDNSQQPTEHGWRPGIVLGAVGTLLILASAGYSYWQLWYLRGADNIDPFKPTVIVAVALFLSGASALVGATRLHGE